MSLPPLATITHSYWETEANGRVCFDMHPDLRVLPSELRRDP